MDTLSIGVDFGSTALRVAYVSAGSLVSVDHPVARGTWMRIELSRASRLGVAFPSLKSRLALAGGAEENDREAPAGILISALTRVRHGIEEQTAQPVSRATICIPARYPLASRAALQEAALAAGFVGVDLISDSVGATLTYATIHPSPATVLVVGAGYEGFELGLVRAAKGHLRVLGYEGGPTAGAALDRLVMDAWFSAVGPYLSTARWGGSEWWRLLDSVRVIKEELSAAEELGAADEIVFPGMTDRSGTTRSVAFSPRDFQGAARQSFLPIVGSLEPLLEKAGMRPSDVDAVVLVGGTTNIPSFGALLQEALGRQPVRTSRGVLAVGAALHAAGLGSRVADGRSPLGEKAALSPSSELAGQPARLRGRAVVTGSERSATAPAPPEPAAGDGEGSAELSPAEYLKRFVDRHVSQGEIEQTRAELDKLIHHALAALDALPSPQADAGEAPDSGAARARRVLASARAYLEQRQFALAVSESHRAWQRFPDDPEVLDQMIEVHREAAAVNTAFEQFEDAVRWLGCAFGHDESNLRTRFMLADRYFLHAQELLRRDRRGEAVDALERCLEHEPEHPGAIELHLTLTSGSAPTGGERDR